MPDQTNSRILEAAGQVFAERGFHAATTRDIASRAEVNVAAINYHFRDKMGLYTEVLMSGMQWVRMIPLEPIEGPPAEQIRAFLVMYLAGLLGQGKPTWLVKLVAREMAQPTEALERIVNEVIRPVEARLRSMIAEFTGLDAESDKVRMSAHSMIGQCLHYHHARHVLEHLWPELDQSAERVQAIADHIYSFSMTGLEGIQAEGDAE